jgi:hypothetical protein
MSAADRKALRDFASALMATHKPDRPTPTIYRLNTPVFFLDHNWLSDHGTGKRWEVSVNVDGLGVTLDNETLLHAGQSASSRHQNGGVARHVFLRPV